MVGSDRVFFNHSIPFNVSLKGRLSHQASLENLIASREQSDFFLNQISDILSKGSNVIFSGEGLSVLSRSEIIYINQYIQSHGYSTEWVAVRAPYQFFCSNVQQQIKEGARYYNLSRLKGQPFYLLKYFFAHSEIFVDRQYIYPFCHMISYVRRQMVY